MSPTLSILLPAFDGARFIDRQIESILDQTYDRFELLVLDDGSRATRRPRRSMRGPAATRGSGVCLPREIWGRNDGSVGSTLAHGLDRR